MTDRATEKSATRPEWLSRKERGCTFAMRAMVYLAFLLGRSAMRPFLPLGCLYFLVSSSEARQASRTYLGRTLERRATWVDVFRHYHAFGACILDRVFLLSGNLDRFDIKVFGQPVIDDIIAKKSGCILLGAHMGSFEVLRSLGRRQSRLVVKMMMFEENARKITSVLNAINPELAKDVITLGKPDSFLALQSSLDNGDMVGILADRSLSRERQTAHSFLGQPARFSVNPFRMLTILRKPVILMFGLYRGGNRYDIHFELFSIPDAAERKPTPSDIDVLVARYVARLEHYCRIAPYNWFNFYDVWK